MFITIIVCLIAGIIYLRIYPTCPDCERCEKSEKSDANCPVCPIIKVPPGAENKLFKQNYNSNAVKITWPENTYFPYGYEANITSIPCEVPKPEVKPKVPAYITNQQNAMVGRPGQSLVVAK